MDLLVRLALFLLDLWTGAATIATQPKSSDTLAWRTTRRDDKTKAKVPAEKTIDTQAKALAEKGPNTQAKAPAEKALNDDHDIRLHKVNHEG